MHKSALMQAWARCRVGLGMDGLGRARGRGRSVRSEIDGFKRGWGQARKGSGSCGR